MKKLIRETAEEILQEYTNCYNEVDEDCLVRMLEKLASNMAREIFEEVDGITDLFAGGAISELEMYDMLGKLKKKYESEGADDE